MGQHQLLHHLLPCKPRCPALPDQASHTELPGNPPPTRSHLPAGPAGSCGCSLQPVHLVVLEHRLLAVLAHPAGKLGLRLLNRVRKLVAPALGLVEGPVGLPPGRKHEEGRAQSCGLARRWGTPTMPGGVGEWQQRWRQQRQRRRRQRLPFGTSLRRTRRRDTGCTSAGSE